MSNQPKKYLVLASSSFTGAHLVEHLLTNTDAEILGVNRSPEPHPVLLPYLHGKATRPARFKFHQLDVNRDLSAILELVDREKPEVIANFSAQGEVRTSWEAPEAWFETNCMSVVRLTSALVKKPFLRRYVAVSTPEVYGATQLNMRESETYAPSTPYAASKLAGDLHLLTLFRRYGFPVVFTRAANLYGIHQQLYRIIPRTVIYLLSNRKIQLHGRGEARRAFIHARDVADATLKLVEKGRAGEVYHLAPDNELFKIAEVVRLVCDRMGKSFESSVEMVDENFGQDPLFSMDASKVRAELGWRPGVKFENGVEEVIRWISDNWKVIKDLPHDYAFRR